MLRLLYSCLLRLHPAGFRERFSEEMLCIFDQTVAGQGERDVRAACRLLADGVASLVRQWTRIAVSPEEADALAADSIPDVGCPAFCSLPSFKPRPGAMIYGAVLSLATFCVVFFAMRYSWTHRAAIVLPVESYAADSAGAESSTPSSQSFTFPSAASSDSQAEAQPQNRFDSRNTEQLSTPETLTSAQTTTDEIKPVSIPGGIETPFYPKAATRMAQLTPHMGENTRGKSSAAAGGGTSSSTSATQYKVVSAPASAGLEAYAGTYIADTASRLEVIVSTKDGRLEIEIDGQHKIATVAASKTKFVLVGKTNDWIEFVEDQDGAVRELDVYLDGERIAAHRR
jgi:hypothetical protein